MKIKWQYKKDILTDWWWLWAKVGISKHFDGTSIWCTEFHLKDSYAWYYNFRYNGDIREPWKTTRLTFRLGRWIVVFGGHPLRACYKNAKVVEVSRFWKRVPVTIGKDYEQHPSRFMCMN